MREGITASEKSLIVFQDKKMRRLWHDDEWFFSVLDIIAILINSEDDLAYWRKLIQRTRDNLSRFEIVCNIWENNSDMMVKVLEGYGQNQNF